jgi:single-stranded-DNA-specific exonuclease
MIDWVINPADEKAVDHISSSLLIDRMQARLLVARGLSTREEAERFLNPSREQLNDPFLFDEMEAASRLLHGAITSGERILIHGDYDADGICGTALLYETLLELGADVHFFIPDRAKDGYGLAKRMMERGVEKDLGLVVSVDCGSSDQEIISYLKEHDITVIVTDHHETRERPESADAFLNPKLPGESYPFKQLVGAGVAYKLLQGLEMVAGVDMSLERRIDLAALGTLGDYALLVDENRAMVALGMEEIAAWRRPGIKALRAESGLSPNGFSARKICFTLIPRLNSPGRIGSAREVVKLLVTGEESLAAGIAKEIEEKNRRRRVHDSSVTEEAGYLADIILKRSDPSALVFSSSTWHEGVVGIGASRLAEKYNMPTVLIAVRGELGKGSARSAGVVNIKEALERCSDLLLEYGGHREAGGFSIEADRIPDFQNAFEETVNEMLEGKEEDSSLHVDAEVTFEDCDEKFLAFLRRLSPFGPGNHEPVLLIRDVEVLPGTRVVGDGHLRVMGRDSRGVTKNLIAFSMAAVWNPDGIIGERIDVLTHARNNVYQGREEVQLQVKAIRLAERSLL